MFALKAKGRRKEIGTGASIMLSNILKHAGNYFAGHIALALLALVAIPVYTSLMLPAQYGQYQIFNSYLGILPALVMLNVSSSVTRHFLDGSADSAAFFGSALAFACVAIVGSFIVMLAFYGSVSSWLGLTPEMLVVLFPAVLVTALLTMFQAFCMATERSRQVALANISRGYIGFALSVGIILFTPLDAMWGPILGTLFAGVAIAPFLARQMAPHLRWNPQRAHLAFMLSYSVPLVFYTAGNALLGQLDRVMINKMVGPAEAGLYSLAYNLGMFLDMVNGALLAASTPTWFRQLGASDHAGADRVVGQTFRIGLFAGLVLLMFGQDLLKQLAHKSYHAAAVLIPLVVVGYVLNSMYKFYLREISMSRRMWHVSLVSILGVALNFALNLVFIPKYGYVAAAWTTVASFLFMVVATWFVARFRLALRVVPFVQFSIPLLIFVLAGTAFWVLPVSAGWSAYGILPRLALLAVAGALFWYPYRRGAGTART